MSSRNGISGEDFRHEALLYAGADDFVSRTGPMIARAVDAGEPVLVAIDATKIELLSRYLGARSRSVIWKDIRGIGGNPARIIPLWHRFVTEHRSSGGVLGFGEPVWSGRKPAELVEAQRHEELLNLAFRDARRFTLLCPYDMMSLNGEVIEKAHLSHPAVMYPTGEGASSHCLGIDAVAAPFDLPLPEPGGRIRELTIRGAAVGAVRRLLVECGSRMDCARREDLTAAIAAVAICVGGPMAGTRLRVWQESGALVAEMSGLAPVDDPLAGREWPAPPEGAGRGLWLANQLCDLVQLRTTADRAVVRLHVSP
jgi:MEDS: MEthanogen/methylotroph, DcmR Sensory domain